MASTSGRAEMCQHSADINVLVRAECDCLRAGPEQARKRRCVALARGAVAGMTRVLRDREVVVELEAIRRCAAEFEERRGRWWAGGQEPGVVRHGVTNRKRAMRTDWKPL